MGELDVIGILSIASVKGDLFFSATLFKPILKNW
jgi:hypothetical protein